MPIEFSCPQCLNPQSVDESKAGQQVYCRVCYFKLTVPAESTNKPIDESQLYTLDAKAWDSQDKQELISFQCDACKTNIGVRKEQVGEEIVCAECGKKIIVPESIAETAEARVKAKHDKAVALATLKETYALHDGVSVPINAEGKQFRFSCRLCGTALFATEKQVGTLITCPDCTTKTQVPAQTIESKPVPLPSSTFEGTTAYNVATPSSVAPQENLVPVVCQFCGTRMQAEESEIGQFKTCPDCGQKTEIKAVAKPIKTTTSTTSADAYVLDKAGATAPRPTVSFFTSPLFATQRRRLSELESSRSLNRPALPKRPLTERFFVPLGDPGMWLPLIIFVAVAPLSMAIVFLPIILFEMKGLGGLWVTVLFLPLFFMFVFAFCYFASFLLYFYNMTSSGMDEGEFRGEIAPADYFANGLWLFVFSFIATVPGFIVGKLILSEPSLIILMMQISHWFFFPIFFLSSIEQCSMLAMLSRNIIISLYRQPFAWFRFYTLTGLLFILADLCFIGAVWLGIWLNTFFVAFTLFFFLFAIQALFFFRLLGRHAWLLEETDRRRRELEEEDK